MGKVLGKGLEAIIKTHNNEDDERYLEGKIDINKIMPNEAQPRQTFDPKKMNELIESIKKNGILQPITVREMSNKTYQIIAGERRYRAAMQAQLKWIPAYTITIKNKSELMEYALIENIQRVNLNPIEEAEGYAVLRGKYDLSQQDIAQKVTKSRSEIANKMRLLKLPPLIKQGLRENQIKYGHARALLTIKESTKIIVFYNKIIKKNLSVRATEAMIKNSIISPHKITLNKKFTDQSTIKELTDSLAPYLNATIKSKISKNKSGTINIHFSSLKDLIRIIKKIKNEQ
tara:strand:- start:600 stop:1463 length:864 start_codon:yes stop_codon:yes gene_type:complete